MYFQEEIEAMQKSRSSLAKSLAKKDLKTTALTHATGNLQDDIPYLKTNAYSQIDFVQPA